MLASIKKGLSEAFNDAAEVIDPSNKLTVTLEKGTYLGGETVIGNVHLTCLVPFKARGVVVKMRGFERCKFDEHRTRTERDSHGHTHTVHETIVHTGRNDFFCLHIPVYPVTGEVSPGDYDFPFQYTLPPNLPGSFRSRGSPHNHLAEVLYYAEAKVDVIHKFDLKSKLYFVVNEVFNKELQPSSGRNYKTFMFTQGQLDARVWLDQNCYFPGNTVISKVEVNNTSKKPTKKLMMKVVRRITIHAHGMCQFSDEIYRQSYPGFEPCFYGVRWLPFAIPMDVQPSTNGNMVKAEYFIYIECDIPGAIDLVVALPTTILAPQWLFSSVPIPPPMTNLPPDVSYRNTWQPDQEAPNCNQCEKKFNLVNRRSHCRGCGKVFCRKCLKKKEKTLLPPLGFDDHKVRACEGCQEKLKNGTLTLLQQPESRPILAAPEKWGAPITIAESTSFEKNQDVLPVYQESKNVNDDMVKPPPIAPSTLTTEISSGTPTDPQ
eukprot:TRINITY_DN11318_c0_g1_i1.p1 TRINITY_DN11318_c0_g1~~TRINITY_DN11318_c0_g1_i1.p1  ORF type:complete len:489 (+),score=122.07 TRINITY_DN11318_c0_g1_i1:1383-2849(+)